MVPKRRFHVQASTARSRAVDGDFRARHRLHQSAGTERLWPNFNTPGLSTLTVDGITAEALTYGGGTSYSASTFWLRKNSNDNGLGVCSTGENCGRANTTGNGDDNELSNGHNDEVIRFGKSNGQTWSDIWLSSLDTGGTNGLEKGVLYFSNTTAPDLSTLTGIGFNKTSVGFSSNEGQAWNYFTSNGLDASAKYLFFRADPTNGTNNDYLVWKVAAVPEPTTYALMAAGLVVVGSMVRRQRA